MWVQKQVFAKKSFASFYRNGLTTFSNFSPDVPLWTVFSIKMFVQKEIKIDLPGGVSMEEFGICYFADSFLSFM